MTSAMRPGQIKPNDFELAILERLASKEPSLLGHLGNSTYSAVSLRVSAATRTSPARTLPTAPPTNRWAWTI